MESGTGKSKGPFIHVEKFEAERESSGLLLAGVPEREENFEQRHTRQPAVERSPIVARGRRCARVMNLERWRETAILGRQGEIRFL